MNTDFNGIKNRRLHPRVSGISEELLGVIAATDKFDKQPFVLWDVSECGLGIWVNSALPVGSIVEITLSFPYSLSIQGEVMWCQKPNSSRGFGIGIKAHSNLEDLQKVCRSLRSGNTSISFDTSSSNDKSSKN